MFEAHRLGCCGLLHIMTHVLRTRSSQSTSEADLSVVYRSMRNPEALFWELANELEAEDPRVHEGTIMNGRCLRVGKEFLALVDYKGSGMVVKLPRDRVAALIDEGVGQPFGPAGKVFKEWVAIPKPDKRRWRKLLHEGVAFVGK